MEVYPPFSSPNSSRIWGIYGIYGIQTASMISKQNILSHITRTTGMPSFPFQGKLVGGWSNPVEKYAQVKLDHETPIFGVKIKNTLPETNIAPKNGWLEDEFPFGMAYFQGYVNFREGIWNHHLANFAGLQLAIRFSIGYDSDSPFKGMTECLQKRGSNPSCFSFSNPTRWCWTQLMMEG